MFLRLATLLPLAALTAVATAALDARGNVCTSGSQYCCNQSFVGPTTFTGTLGGALTASANVGLTCNPVVGGVSCTSQNACCNNVQANGVVNVVCSPINV